MAYVLVWEYTVRRTATAEFEQMYGHDGGWVTFFRTDPAYISTELLRAETAAPRYLTIDRWRAADAYERFREVNAERYRELDAKGDRLTESERFIGAFTVLDSARS